MLLALASPKSTSFLMNNFCDPTRSALPTTILMIIRTIPIANAPRSVARTITPPIPPSFDALDAADMEFDALRPDQPPLAPLTSVMIKAVNTDNQ